MIYLNVIFLPSLFPVSFLSSFLCFHPHWIELNHSCFWNELKNNQQLKQIYRTKLSWSDFSRYKITVHLKREVVNRIILCLHKSETNQNAVNRWINSPLSELTRHDLNLFFFFSFVFFPHSVKKYIISVYHQHHTWLLAWKSISTSDWIRIRPESDSM